MTRPCAKIRAGVAGLLDLLTAAVAYRCDGRNEHSKEETGEKAGT
ncbi:hypothetical protein RCCS2_10525 [Roseobacter sp. CCS2]|nr:hypothetical protein RCCS2_10525 [Roseobacter sp. CCS2]